MNRCFVSSLLVLLLFSVAQGQQKERLRKLAMPPTTFEVIPQSGAAFDKADAIFQPALKDYQQNRDDMDRGAVMSALRKSAMMGHARAMYYLGELAEFGDHVVQNDRTAYAWYERSAAFGDLEAMQNVAQCLDFGRGVKEDPKKSKQVYRQILKTLETQGTTESKLQLAEIYIEDDFDLGEQPLKAEKILKTLADEGNVAAHLQLHDLYYFGSGKVAKDSAKSFTHGKFAADSGHVSTMAVVGEMLIKGEGCEKNVELGEEYYLKAHEAGSGIALIGLSGMYLRGEGVEQDIDKGVALLRKSIAAESTPALILLAEMYEKGEHVKADMSKAIEIWEIGKQWDLGESYLRLFKIYSKGKHKDSAKAKAARAELNAWYDQNEVPVEYRDFK